MNKYKKTRGLLVFFVVIITILTVNTVEAANLCNSCEALKKNPRNRDLIIKVQAENKLTPDGSLGPATRKAMNGELEVRDDILPESVRKDNYFIMINKSTNALTVFKKGNTIGRYPVALGKSGTNTPSYKFKIGNKAVNPYWGGIGGKYKPIKGGAPNNPLGKRWMGLSGGGLRGYGIHGNAAPNSIGKNISAGCVRMINSDVENIYKFIPVGTKVWVGTQQELNNWGIMFGGGHLSFGPKENKPNKPKKPVLKDNQRYVTPSNVNIKVNETSYNLDVYNIKDNNYFKLRDIAYMLKDTNLSFDTTWQGGQNILIENKPYTNVGGEMSKLINKKQIATENNIYLKINENIKTINAFNVNDNNFVKIRDISNIIGAEIDYIKETNTIIIKTI